MWAFTLSFLKYLKEKNFDVQVASSPGKEERHFREADIPFFVVPIPRKIRPLQDLKAVLRLYRFMKKEKFDMVHTQTAKAGYVTRVAAWLAGIPIIIYTAHAFPFHAYLGPLKKKFFILLERLASRVTDIILVDTEAVRRDGIDKKIKGPEEIVTVHMGVDLNKFSLQRVNRSQIRVGMGLSDHHLVVGTVANFVPDKGLDIFLKIAKLVKKGEKNIKFLMVGDGPLRPELESLADALHLKDDVIFMGWREDIPEMMSAMDVFCLPTLREGFGVVFAEVMAMKVPVVTHWIEPIPEVVQENKTGILIPLGREDLFAEAILSLIRNKKFREEMGERGRTRVEEYFDERFMFEKTFQVYEELIEAKAPLLSSVD